MPYMKHTFIHADSGNPVQIQTDWSARTSRPHTLKTLCVVGMLRLSSSQLRAPLVLVVTDPEPNDLHPNVPPSIFSAPVQPLEKNRAPYFQVLAVHMLGISSSILLFQSTASTEKAYRLRKLAPIKSRSDNEQRKRGFRANPWK